MSWLVARSTTTQEANSGGKKFRFEEPLTVVELPGLSLALGGLPDTCLWRVNQYNLSGWAVIGTGIKTSGDCSSIMDPDDWEIALGQSSFDCTALDGHFIAMRWKEGTIEFFSDQLGLRTLFYSSSNHDLCLCSRLDWTCKLSGKHALDLRALSTRWLLFNQLDYGSGIECISRMGPGGKIIVRDGKLVSKEDSPWCITSSESSETPMNALQRLMQAAMQNQSGATLGLSGGLDSRVLLALRMANGPHPIDVHTFGEECDPDFEVAGNISRELGLRQLLLPDEEFPVSDVLLRNLRSFAAQMCLTEPISSFGKLRHYAQIRSSAGLLIDGGFGELARRQYLNRFVRFGSDALKNNCYKELIQYFRVDRGRIFSEEIMQTLEQHAVNALQNTIQSMPPAGEIGMGTFADLLTIRTRVPNYGSPGQTRLDAAIQNFMPFVQPSFLRAVFSMNSKYRSRSRVHYDTIDRFNPSLARYPLIRAGVYYPYGLSTLSASLITRIKTRLGLKFLDRKREGVFKSLREYILDRSNSVDSSGMLDQRAISTEVEGYYAGKPGLHGNLLDWWLTFTFWRDSLSE